MARVTGVGIVKQLHLKMNGLPTVDRLLVTHRLKPPAESTPRFGSGNDSAPIMNRGALQLDTCLREVAIELLPEAGSSLPALHGNDREILAGVDAYRLLLEIATGLRSAIPGETNVFGQFRAAWQAFLHDGHPATAAGLTPLIHRLFNDTKTVRSDWLEGVGGSSYGSLVRKLIGPRRQDRVLFVGAGELMRSMLPFFGKFRLGVWRHRDVKPMAATVDYVFGPEDGRRAASWADHVILTTPRDQHNDQIWHAWLSRAHPRTVVHLGHRCSDRIDWGPGIAAFDLDDIFALQREQNDARSGKLDRARAACAMLASALHDEPTTRQCLHPVYDVNLVAT